MHNKLVQNSQEQYHVDLIYATLKQEILDLIIPPGTIITEAGMCKRFSVSRTPVHSALKRLADRRLINIVPYKEIKVTRINLHQIKQMIYMRIAIETMVVRDFINLHNPLLMEKLRYHLRRQIALLDTEFSPHEFYAEDSAFHQIWFDAIEMNFLWKKIQHAQVHYTRFRMLDIVEVRDFNSIVKEHETLFSIIEKKKIEAVEPFFIQHFNGGIQRLGERIHTEYSGYFEPEKNGKSLP
jgi:DNA-binding GntR family transcriptional regulator